MAAGREEDHQENVQTIYEHDAFGRIVAIRTQEEGLLTQYHYHNPGNIQQIFRDPEDIVPRPNGGVHRFFYDSQGRCIQEIQTVDNDNNITMNY